MKENVRMIKISDELGENSKNVKENRRNAQNYFLTQLKHFLKTMFTS